MRHLGIDYGTKKIGLALSDEAGTMGFPHATLQNDAALISALLALITEKEIGAIVMGESLDSSGVENPVAKEARAFGTKLSETAGIPVHYEFEAFTTQEARRDPEGNRTQTGMLDASAAALILTSYLSHHGRQN